MIRLTLLAAGPVMLRRLALGLLLLSGWGPLLAQTPVTLQLKWTHAFQFAGYYAALDKGYYREAGLDVRIEEAQPGVDVIDRVLTGQADFGVGTSSLLMARKAGRPVVALAVIFQHSPLVLIARKQHAAQSIHDIAGKQVMIEPQSDELLAYLKQEGIPVDQLTQLQHSFNPRDLIDGKVDAISAYVTNEVYDLNQARVPYQIFTPRSVGIDFYGDNLFTSAQQIDNHPERVKAFREASLRGWQYAMDHPEEIAQLIPGPIPGPRDLDFYRFEARQMVPLLRPDLIEIGYMNPGRWRHIADTYADLGMLPRDFSLEGFLYEPHPKADLAKLRAYLAAALVAMAIAGAVAALVYRGNRRLARSVDELHRAQAALAESEARFRTLTDTSAAGVYVLHGNKFAMVNPALVALSGYTEQEILAMEFQELIHPEHRTMVMGRAMTPPRDGETARDEFKLITKRGESRWVELTAGRLMLHGETSSIGTIYDITERKRIEDRIKHMAQHDGLTGLANRGLFADRFRQALASAKRDRYRLALIFLDLDDFKPVNDDLGHAVGDGALKEVARRLKECVRDSDTVARIGGDEFVVLLRTIEESQNALAVAEKIQQALSRPVNIGGHRLHLSASIGVAIHPEHGVDELELARNADFAMYRAKKLGRDNIQLFHYEEPLAAAEETRDGLPG